MDKETWVQGNKKAINKEALFSAFVAGFKISGEGWNGEYPYDDWGDDPTNDLRTYFTIWLSDFERKFMES